MKLPAGNPCPREGINATGTSGLGEFATLAVGLGIGAVVLTAVLTLAIGWLAPFIPFEWEQAIAGQVDPGIATSHPDAQADLQQLAARLATSADLPDGMSIQVHLSDDNRPNAFATLGGHIIVTRGLLRQVSSENALSMVLAHEIAHVEHRDPISALGRGAVVNLVWATVAGATGQSAVQNILGSAGLLTLLRFNRDMERAADQAALTTLQNDYGHARGAGEFFRKLQRQHNESEWSTLLRTHPRTDERLQAIAAATATGDAEQIKLRPLPPAIGKLAAKPDPAR